MPDPEDFPLDLPLPEGLALDGGADLGAARLGLASAFLRGVNSTSSVSVSSFLVARCHRRCG